MIMICYPLQQSSILDKSFVTSKETINAKEEI